MPTTLNEIKKYAFYNCSSLRYLRIPSSVQTIGENAFKNCHRSLTFYTSKNSNALVYAVEHGIAFVIEDYDAAWANGVFNGANTMYYANLESMVANRCIPCTLKYEITDQAYGQLSNMSLSLFVPKGTELLEETLKLNGSMLTNYNLNGSKLTLPVSGQSGQLTFSLRLTDAITLLTSYAYLSYRQNNVNYWQCIDLINEDVMTLTLDVPDTANEKTIEAHGSAPAASVITLFVNGQQQVSTVSARNGAYSATLNLGNPSNGERFEIAAMAEDSDGNNVETYRTIVYREDSPEVAEFLMYYNNHKDTFMDLLDPSSPSSSVYFNPAYPMTFTLKIENDEDIRNVYVTSTRNNVKYVMEAVFDSSRDLYVASGYFNPNQHNYVPGNIGVEIAMAHDQMTVKSNLDVSQITPLDTSIGTVTSQDHTVVATIDLGNISKDLAEEYLKATLKTIDLKHDTSLADIWGYKGDVETIFSYIVPGVDDEKYLLYLDFSDPKNIMMIVADAAGEADTAYQLFLSQQDFASSNYADLFDLGEKLSNAATFAKVAYKMYGIDKDHNELINDINQSTTIADKSTAIRKADELRQDQIAFLLLTTALPLLVAGGPMAGPAIVFSALVGTIVVLSDTFWDLRVADIKGEKIKLKWCLDPSGYVYEAVTTNRLEGVESAAYWVEYDEEDEGFWDHMPGDGDGILWDASEWNQVNPMLTDSDGRYQWDVPEGWWQVRFNKEGYDQSVSDSSRRLRPKSISR